MTVVQTKFAGRNPFKPKPEPKPRTPLDLARVVKCRDPYKPDRVVKEHKYKQLFAGVEEGDCFRVTGGSTELSALARALRLYLKKHGIDGIVRQQGRTEDGIGRVWLVKVVDRK
jgi:hypothetical protein